MKKKLLISVLAVCAVLTTACGENSGNADSQQENVSSASAVGEQKDIELAEEYYQKGIESYYSFSVDSGVECLDTARENFLKAVELGNTDANFYLGLLCDVNSCPSKDYVKAREYYEKAGDNPFARLLLADLYGGGQGGEQDEEYFKKVTQEVADSGVAEAYRELGIISYLDGDFETAAKHFQKVIDEGSEKFFVGSALSWLGGIYTNENYSGYDLEKGTDMVKRAADMGAFEGLCTLGTMYMSGNGVPKDTDEAIRYLTAAAYCGHPSAPDFLASLYETAFDEPDYENAAKWYQFGIDNCNSAFGMGGMGIIYMNGYGVDLDIDKAIEYFEQGAPLGDCDSNIYLGVFCDYGLGVEKDTDKAAECYERAIAADAEKTIATVGQAFIEMDDTEKAKEWYQKYADEGYESARELLEEMG